MKQWLVAWGSSVLLAVAIFLSGVVVGIIGVSGASKEVPPAPVVATPVPDFTVVSVVSYSGYGDRQGMYATVLVEGQAYEHYIAGLGGPSLCVEEMKVGEVLPDSCR